MPTTINNNTRVLANRIADDAKAAGMSRGQLESLGNKILERFNPYTMNVQTLAAVRDHAVVLADALTMAANELAVNTAPDPVVVGGVTA